MKIDHVYFINLDRRTDRLHKMTKILQDSGLADISSRFSAIDGKKLKPEHLEKYTDWVSSIFCCKSLIGCAMSHISIWKHFYHNTDYQNILILEDDIIMKTDINKFIKENEKRIPTDFDIFYLGCFLGNTTEHHIGTKFLLSLAGKAPFNLKNSKEINDLIIKPLFPLGLHAYILSRSGAKKLIELSPIINTHIDLHLAHKIYDGEIKAYSLKTSIVDQEDSLNPTDNINYSFPMTINKILDKYKIQNGQSYSYFANASIHEIPILEIPLNIYVFVSFILGLILVSLDKFDPHRVFKIFVFFVIVDTTINPVQIKKSIIFSSFLLLLMFLPWGIKNVKNRT